MLAVDFDFGWDDEDEDYEMVVGAQQPQQPAPSPVKPGHRRFASAQASSGPPRAQVAVEHAPAASLHPAQPYLLLHALRGRLGATVIIALSLLLVLMGQSLVASVALDAVAGTARLIFVSIAAVSVAIAAPVTHGVAGPLRHAHSGFKFWQPGMGGLAFVACQALGWALYAISVLAFITAFWCAPALRACMRVRACISVSDGRAVATACVRGGPWARGDTRRCVSRRTACRSAGRGCPAYRTGRSAQGTRLRARTGSPCSPL